MLLSLLWDEIVADDMMFSVKVMKLLIWNVLLKLNSKSYHVVKEKGIIYAAILKTRRERNSKIFFFLSPCLVLMRRGLARMVENVMWKFQKLNFASSFHQYSNSCEEYFGGDEFKVGTFLSTVPIQKNSWIDQIWTKFATGWEMVFFFPCIIYKSKVNSLKNVRAEWSEFRSSLRLTLIFLVYSSATSWFLPIIRCRPLTGLSAFSYQTHSLMRWLPTLIPSLKPSLSMDSV